MLLGTEVSIVRLTGTAVQDNLFFLHWSISSPRVLEPVEVHPNRSSVLHCHDDKCSESSRAIVTVASLRHACV